MNTRHNTQPSSISMNVDEENSGSIIPFDLTIEILTRLPAKSIARFRCLSKQCYSILRGSYFTDKFLTLSLSRPKLWFVCLKGEKTYFFSSPQPQNSSPLTAKFQMGFPNNYSSFPVRSLVFGLKERIGYDDMPQVGDALICNPSTGQFFTLPKVENLFRVLKVCLGYDPIGKQIKVLCMSLSSRPHMSTTYQVLTLGTGVKLSWRMIECDIQHYPYVGMGPKIWNNVYNEVCINGVCYYFARLMNENVLVIVCFDIRFEKFSYIRLAQGMGYSLGTNVEATLVNYKDKLAKLQLLFFGGICTSIQLWILKEAVNHEWSSYLYLLPPWENIVKESKLRIVGRNTRTGEIVLSPRDISVYFYLLFYNPDRNTISKVEFQGMKAFNNCNVYTCLDHVEDVKLTSYEL